MANNCNPPRFACPYCTKTFAFRSGLSRHIKKDHSEKKEATDSLGCNLCDSRLVHCHNM